MWKDLELSKGDVEVLLEFAELGDTTIDEVGNELEKFIKTIEEIELKMILGKSEDSQGAIITIHPGAGGTESQDWAEMLYRMYSRWIERKGFIKEILKTIV